MEHKKCHYKLTESVNTLGIESILQYSWYFIYIYKRNLISATLDLTSKYNTLKKFYIPELII